MDIVERLRSHWGKFGVSRGDFVTYSHEAADEIERLREALQSICDGQRDADKSYAELFAEVKTEAREALKEGE